MITMNLGLMAEKAHIDASGKLYILGEFRYLGARKLPTQYGQMAVVARWEAPLVEVRDRDNTIQIEIVDQDGGILAPRSPKMKVRFVPIGSAQPGAAQAVLVFEMNGFPLTKYGAHVIHFFINEQHAGEVKFHVTSIPVTPKAPPQPPPPDAK